MARKSKGNKSGKGSKKDNKPKMTNEQLQLEKDVKRINERINEIAKKYGTGSFAYNKYYSAVVMGLPSRFRRFSKNGIVQLSRSKEFYETINNPETQQAITRLLGLKTSGQLRKAAKKSLLDEERAKVKVINQNRKINGMAPLPMPKKPSEAQIKQREIDIDEVNEFVADNRAMFYMSASKEVNQLIHTKGRRKTYGEMIQIIHAYQKGGGMDSRNLFEGL